MSKKINKNKYIVIEGVVDIININEKKVTNNEIVYAGMLNVEYGIKLLIDAFILLNNGEYTLELYGTGNYVKDIESICLQYKNINYHGIVSNDMIIKKEEDAFLLVNPRCSKDEFTKYSFPSKNMEYMLSGTPMLCSKLPGLPHEYKNYVYIFEDETVEGLAKTLKEIISLNKNIHLKKGKDAQKFVLENKNKIIQAKKIIAFLEDR